MKLPDTTNRVLVVEDDEASRTELVGALQSGGYEAVAVENGLEALDYLRWKAAPVVCVVLDMRLPVMTGWELHTALAEDPTLRSVPLIGVTGGHWKQHDSSGFVALISKPINYEELLAAVDRCASAPPAKPGRGG